MINGSLSALSAVLNGRLVGEDAPFHGLSSDTRALMPGNLFVALKGERYDAHDLLAAAVAAGAAGVVVEREVDVAAPQIVVADTRLALADLARDWRRRHPIPVVAITGSNGKTTTKELVASILRQHGETLATVGNLNNDIGVPLTLSGLGAEHRYAVIEMGANRPDDIAQLVAIAEPEVALVTMCGPAHLAGFGSLAGVARAKGQIYAQLKPGNTAIINLDDPFHAQWEGTAAPARLLGFGLSESAAVTARDIKPLPLGEGSSFTLCIDGACTEVHLPLDGLHNVRTALAAAAGGVALALPLPRIRAGLESVAPVKGRLNVRRSGQGLTVIDDSYNANPASLAAAVGILAEQAGRRWLVLGDMRELGPEAVAIHREAGRAAREAGIDRLLGIGELAAEAVAAFGANAKAFATREEALHFMTESELSGLTLLVKGSRSMQLDLLVKALMAGPEVSSC